MPVPKVHNGTSFVPTVMKVWNGTAWVETPAYYNGASWIPLYPQAGGVVSLFGTTVFSTDAGVPVTATFTVNNDGTVSKYTNFGGTAYLFDWLTPTSEAPGLYEVRFTLASGTTPTDGDTLGVWHALTSTRSVGNTRSGTTGTTTSTLTCEIRYNGGAVLDSCSVTVSANWEP